MEGRGGVEDGIVKGTGGLGGEGWVPTFFPVSSAADSSTDLLDSVVDSLTLEGAKACFWVFDGR